MQGMHTVKEDGDKHTLKFRPWSVRTKLFEALSARLNRYAKRQETVATVATTSVAPVFEQLLNKEKRDDGNGHQPKVQPMGFT